MKIADKARAAITEILETHGGDATAYTVAGSMQDRGWLSVTEDNIIDTARSLGFTVIGAVIYQLDA